MPPLSPDATGGPGFVPTSRFGRSRASWWSDLRIAQWLHIAGATPFQILVPVVLAAAVAALEGTSIGLLVPIATGVTQRDFDFVRSLPVFSAITRWWPGWFPPGPESSSALFLLVASTAFLAALAKNALAYGSHLISSHWYGLYLKRANEFLFRRCLGFGKLYFDRVHQSSLQTTLGHTGELIDLLNLLQRALLNLFLLAAYLVVMLWISWRLTLFVLVFFPLTHTLGRRLARRTESLSRDLNEATLVRHAIAFNILSCLPLFTAYGQEEQAARNWAGNAEVLRRLNFRINAVQGLVGPFQEVMTLTAVLATIAFVVFHLAAREPTELAVFLVFLFAVRTALPRFTGLYEILVGISGKRARLADLSALLDDGDKCMVPDGTREFDGLREAVTVRDLRFGYRPDALVLHGIDAVFRKGTVTALVGPSGAGKSTLAHLLMGFYPAPPGSIEVDGHDLRGLRIASWRRRLAIVSQDLLLFNDTLRSNIVIGTERAIDDTELFEALRRARLGDFVRDLPDGLDSRVGDRGVRLSGGERQRVAICRALLRRPEILILDEATSALDSETERLIQEALDELMAGRTAIVIAHRLSTIRHADHVVFLEKGRVVEQGSVAALLARAGRFSEFWLAQQAPGVP